MVRRLRDFLRDISAKKQPQHLRDFLRNTLTNKQPYKLTYDERERHLPSPLIFTCLHE